MQASPPVEREREKGGTLEREGRHAKGGRMVPLGEGPAHRDDVSVRMKKAALSRDLHEGLCTREGHNVLRPT